MHDANQSLEQQKRGIETAICELRQI